VLLGLILSIALFVPRAAKLRATELVVTAERVVRERTTSDPPDPENVIYDLEGELFFGAAPELDRHLSELLERIESEDQGKIVILRLKRVRHPDVVCIERIEHFLRELTERGVTVLLAGVRPDTFAILKNVGFQAWFPAEHVFLEENQEFSATLKAVRYAHAKSTAERLEEPELYYLV
jgi:sulfate permease, SulP family